MWLQQKRQNASGCNMTRATYKIAKKKYRYAKEKLIIMVKLNACLDFWEKLK